MCSVIEIKNNDEYYIRYHSPDSMVENTVADKNGKKSEKSLLIKRDAPHSGSDDGTNTTSGDSGHQRDVLSNSPKSQMEEPVVDEFGMPRQNDATFDLLKNSSIRKKDVEVTSDRGSSEESIIEEKGKDNSGMEGKDKSGNNARKRGAKYHSTNNNNSTVSIEKVPITINSHIPASPERVINQKTVTHDTGTQMGSLDDTSKISYGNAKPSKNITRSISNENNLGKTSNQDNVKDIKPKESLIVQSQDGYVDKNLATKPPHSRKEVLQHQMKNDNGELQTLVDNELRLDHLIQSPNASELQQISHSHENVISKKSFMCRSSSSNNQDTEASVIPTRLEEKQKSSIPKQSSIPILIKTEISPRKKLSSLIGSSKCSTDGKDKGDKKEHKKNKSSSGSSLDENTNKEQSSSRKGLIKTNAKQKKKNESNKKGDSNKNSKISPIVALSNQCKNGFGKRKTKNLENLSDKTNDVKSKSDSANSSKNGNEGKKDKLPVKKSYSMDSIGDIYKSLPKTEQTLRKDHKPDLHYSQNQIDIQKSFFEQHPHAVLKAAKTKDGYTVYGSGKKWTLASGKYTCYYSY